jgi:hypothetical protein
MGVVLWWPDECSEKLKFGDTHTFLKEKASDKEEI